MKEAPKKSLIKSVAVLSSGTAAGQAILLVSAPILTRLYSPEQFGLLAVYLAAIAIPSAIATLRYELVIPLPRRDDVAANALALTLLCVAIASALCAAVLGIWGDFFSKQFNMPGLSSVSWLIPLGVLGIGGYTAMSQWNVRRRSFGTIARTKLVQATSQTFIQIVSALTPFSTFGLLFGSLAGQTAGISSFVNEFRRFDAALVRRITWRRIWFLARHYWEFPVFSMWGSVAYAASNQLPALLMFWLFGPATSGFYILAQRVGMMPATMVSEAMGRALYRTLATSKKKPQVVGHAVLEPVQMMTNLILAPAILAAMVAPHVTGLVFGANWEEAGLYLRWMAPWLTVTVIFGVMSPIVSVMRFQKMGLFFQVSSLVVSIAAMSVGGHLWGPVAAIASYSIARSACIVVYRLHMFHLLQVSPLPLALRLLIQTAGFLGLFWYALKIATGAEVDPAYRWGAFAALLATSGVIYIAINFLPYLRNRLQRRSCPSA